MTRRYSGHMNGERYLANTSPSKLEVHDLDNEKTEKDACQIDEIIKAGHDIMHIHFTHHYTSKLLLYKVYVFLTPCNSRALKVSVILFSE